jgi:hypothetical protein
MGDVKPVTTDKIILPKNLQREMIKFFIQASIAKNVKENTGKEEQQSPLNTQTEEC